MPKYRELMEQTGVPVHDQPQLILGMQRYLNMVGGCRPSDAMRSEIADYQRLGSAEYRNQLAINGAALRGMGY